jgi:hypothetical protein
MEVFDETDTDAPDTWTGGVPLFVCPRPSTIYCSLVNARPMDLIEHMQEDHRTPDVDLDPMPLSEIFVDRYPGDVDLDPHVDVDLDEHALDDVDLDREPQWDFGEDWNF